MRVIFVNRKQSSFPASYLHMGIIDAFVQFIIGLINFVVDIIRYILNFFLQLLNMTGL